MGNGGPYGDTGRVALHRHAGGQQSIVVDGRHRRQRGHVAMHMGDINTTMETTFVGWSAATVIPQRRGGGTVPHGTDTVMLVSGIEAELPREPGQCLIEPAHGRSGVVFVGNTRRRVSKE